MAPTAGRYEGIPDIIMGNGRRRYQKKHISEILRRYGKRHAKGGRKSSLLHLLVDLEKTIPDEDKKIIARWMRQSLPLPALSKFFDDALGENKPVIVDCTVCMESLELGDFPQQKLTSSCDHKSLTCASCLTQSIEAQIADTPWDQITCPQCPELVSFESVKSVVSAEAFERQYSNLDRYDMKSVMATFEHMPNFTMCLGPNCNSGQIHWTEDDQPIMTCNTCHFKTCFTHKMPWHSDQTCGEYDAERKERMDQEAASEKVLQETTKKCPNGKCGLNCEKVSGCDHMTCHKCKFQFCWMCFAPYLGPTGIDRAGNSAHAPNCKYHSANLPAGATRLAQMYATLHRRA
ncbi:E3 ubiquitin-protein ligase dbl4 [Lachnellula suecica]|uniref:RBR-type E3 ubiquitin transferase n=1 Tax=Lachnellula suecica TaxID=602035 RepID=A0A8T9BUZ9_9HELO|nr:E3 ubiquitin-protein ligase dbl4 [Lachnellula suecica]